MASFYTTLSGSTGQMEYFENPVGEPYVDLYSSADDGFGARPLWSKDSDESFYNVDACKWNSCGGHGIHEVTVHQSLSDLWDMWPSSERPWSTFVGNDDRCVVRGGSADGSTGVFMISQDGCETGFGDNGQHAFRVTLLPIALK